MQILIDIGLILLGYLIGSIPTGLIIVKLKTGKDLRNVESGRTGGTNALRAAGFWAGLATALLDVFKAALAVWLAQWLSAGSQLIPMLAPIAAILGHNYSLFMPEYDENGRFRRLRGGAGGAPTVGGAIGLWPPSVLIMIPLGALVFFTVWYASVTTMSVAVFAVVIFGIRLAMGVPGANLWDVVYGIVATLLLVWALRPNIQKLMNGTERVVSISLHGVLKARQEKRKDEHK